MIRPRSFGRVLALTVVVLTLSCGCKFADFELKVKDANLAVPGGSLAPLIGTQQQPKPNSDSVAARL